MDLQLQSHLVPALPGSWFTEAWCLRCTDKGWRQALRPSAIGSFKSSPTPQFKSINSSALSFLYSPTLTSIHDHWKNHSLDQTDLCWQVMSLLFNMLSRLVITFLPRSKHLLISWLQSPSAVISEPPKIKSATVSTVSPSICHEVMGPDAMILVEVR